MKTKRLPSPSSMTLEEKVGAKVVFLPHHPKAGNEGTVEKVVVATVFVKVGEETVRAHYLDVMEIVE